MDPDRIDFSSLDPSRDALRYERTVRALAAKAAARRMRLDDALLRWARPALAVAAVLAALAWLPALWSTDSQPAAQPDQVAAFTDYAVRGGAAPADWFLGLGGSDGN